MIGRLVLASAVLALLLLPVVAPLYYVLLMLPFMAYAVVLLGLNLLFGYTGLVSFGHALFIGIGAYAGAFVTTHTPVRSLEVILIAAGVLGAVVAAPVGALCVRYVKIYFGMLTLAFGMLFYTFLLKFYRLTGGDEGMRVLRPSLLGLDLGAMPKTDYLAGPYYYYSLGILAVAALVMWRIVHSPFGLCLKSVRDNPAKAEALGLGVTRYRWHAFVISAVYAAVGGALLGPHRERRPHARLLDAVRQHRLHDAARGIRELLRPHPGRLRLHLPAGHRHVGRAVLAPRLRRHPRVRGDLRAERAHGALRPRRCRRRIEGVSA